MSRWTSRREKLCFKQYFPLSYPSDMDDLAMTCSDFVNALKMLICSEKHLVLELLVTMALPKKW